MKGKKFIRKPELDNKDHDFAKWLRANGWNYNHAKIDDVTTEFYDGDGRAIARGVYDNFKMKFEVSVAADITKEARS